MRMSRRASSHYRTLDPRAASKATDLTPHESLVEDHTIRTQARAILAAHGINADDIINRDRDVTEKLDKIIQQLVAGGQFYETDADLPEGANSALALLRAKHLFERIGHAPPYAVVS
jgi:hypothetical protein